MTNNTESSSSLRFGDESALWTYGSEAQSSLSLVSKLIASASTSEETEKTLNSIISSTDELERLGESRRRGFLSLFHKDNTEELYRSLLKRISTLTVSLRLRQAELAKDLAVLDRAQAMLGECCSQLDSCVEQGRTLQKQHEHLLKGSSYASEIANCASEEAWLSRFSLRMESLELSRTIALQTAAQIKLLAASKKDLMQKLQTIIANVIPLWRNQVSLVLGLSQISAENVSANRVGAAAKNSIKSAVADSSAIVREVARNSKESDKDMQSLLESSTKLLEALREIRLIEEDCIQTNSETISTLNESVVLELE